LRQYHTSPFKAAKRERIAGICHVERSRRAGEGAVETSRRSQLKKMPIRGVLAKVLIVSSQSMHGEIRGKTPSCCIVKI
jgi:hypothetical protein